MSCFCGWKGGPVNVNSQLKVSLWILKWVEEGEKKEYLGFQANFQGIINKYLGFKNLFQGSILNT